MSVSSDNNERSATQALAHFPWALLALLGPVACAWEVDGAGTTLHEGEPVLAKATSEATTQPAVEVQKDCAGKAGVYCIIARLQDGAILKPFLASSPLLTGGTAECRGWANTFAEKTAKEFTTLDLTYDGYSPRSARVLVSGSFHNDRGKPAFPIKVKEGGWVATYGYECNPANGANDMRVLFVRNSERRAFIEPFSLTKFNANTSAPEAVVGLTPSFSKGAATKRGRNFVGLTSPYNGGYGTVVFVVAPNSSTYGLLSSQAVSILKSKGCPDSQIIQLDGSTSSQVSENVNGTWAHRIAATRQMPQAFAIFTP